MSQLRLLVTAKLLLDRTGFYRVLLPNIQTTMLINAKVRLNSSHHQEEAETMAVRIELTVTASTETGTATAHPTDLLTEAVTQSAEYTNRRLGLVIAMTCCVQSLGQVLSSFISIARRRTLVNLKIVRCRPFVTSQ